MDDVIAEHVLDEKLRLEDITDEMRQSWANEAKERERKKAENAQSACAHCPGFCCLAFAIVTERDTPKKMREGIPVKEKLIEDLNAKRELRATMDLYFHRRQPKLDSQWEKDIRYYKEAIEDSKIVAPMLVRLKTTANVGKNWRTGKRDKVYTCKHYQVAERRCGIYEKRPQMCRSFYCETAHEGRPPNIQDQIAHPDRTPSVALKLPAGYAWEPLPKPPRKERVKKHKGLPIEQDCKLLEEVKA